MLKELQSLRLQLRCVPQDAGVIKSVHPKYTRNMELEDGQVFEKWCFCARFVCSGRYCVGGRRQDAACRHQFHLGKHHHCRLAGRKFDKPKRRRLQRHQERPALWQQLYDCACAFVNDLLQFPLFEGHDPPAVVMGKCPKTCRLCNCSAGARLLTRLRNCMWATLLS